MINQIPEEKVIFLNNKNNNKLVFGDIVMERYTHIFMSSKIAFSQCFKNNILDQTFFTNCFFLFANNEIYKVEEQVKHFRPIYVKIEKNQK